MKPMIVALLFSLGLSQTAFAAEQDNKCTHFNIHVSNLTDYTCALTSLSVKHGNAITYPDGTIKPNSSNTFEMEQTIIGPEIRLSYQCGENSISFTSKQDLCVVKAGKVKGTIHEPKPENATVTFTTMRGSYFWNKAGMIYWTISKNN